MFQFSSNTKVEQKFKMNDLYKMLKIDKELKAKCHNITSVQMTNALSERTTGLKPSAEVNEIYIMRIDLSDENVPIDFVKALDKFIRFQVVYEVWHESKMKYMVDFKTITDEKVQQTRFFETTWQEQVIEEMPLVGDLTELFKAMLTKVASLEFRPKENIKEWLLRYAEIEKCQKEFAKYEKLANNEPQPKKKFEYNEKLRQIYEELRGLK